MGKNICGNSCCDNCGIKDTCSGCAETKGHPFGGACVVAECCMNRGLGNCDLCPDSLCTLKKQIISEFNSLGIKDMPKVTDLYELNGAFINLEYTLPSGQKVKFWDDNRVYLGNQLEKTNSDRCYGLTADEHYLLVCEYGENGADPQIIVFKQR